MAGKIHGIHHITALAGNARSNLGFYTKVLGLRLVKKTVNFDDPGTYHFYYGNGKGEPGTILTFFPWEGIPRGRTGSGQVTVVSFSVPRGSMEFWIDRFRSLGVDFNNPGTRFEEENLVFLDHDGLKLELVSHPYPDERTPWAVEGIPAEHAIRGFFGAALTLEGYESTADLLTDLFGFEKKSEHVNRFRFVNPNSSHANVLDLVCLPAGMRGRVAGGTVHHIAFRVANEADQLALREKLIERGYNATPQLDRNYFKSVYFREPGGVLFEIATDPPGFTVDEDEDRLGEKLMLPSWLEGRRDEIESVLPSMD